MFYSSTKLSIYNLCLHYILYWFSIERLVGIYTKLYIVEWFANTHANVHKHKMIYHKKDVRL